MKIYNFTFYISLLNLSNVYNIPKDIYNYIYSIIINISAQKIIHKWFSYIYIHNIHLCDIINRLTILQDYDIYGNPFSYYDLYDSSIGKTFNICTKFLSMNISYYHWWKNILQYAFNGLMYIEHTNDEIFKFNYNSIINFQQRFYI